MPEAPLPAAEFYLYPGIIEHLYTCKLDASPQISLMAVWTARPLTLHVNAMEEQVGQGGEIREEPSILSATIRLAPLLIAH